MLTALSVPVSVAWHCRYLDTRDVLTLLARPLPLFCRTAGSSFVPTISAGAVTTPTTSSTARQRATALAQVTLDAKTSVEFETCTIAPKSLLEEALVPAAKSASSEHDPSVVLRL